MISNSTARVAVRAFANAKGPMAPRVDPVLTTITAAVPMPSRTSKRGSASVYPFDALTAVGMSFGVKNKTAAQMSSIVSNANRKALIKKTDATGAVIFKTQELTAGDGTKTIVPTNEPEMIASKHFFAVDIDPKAKPADPDGATVRVFRDA